MQEPSSTNRLEGGFLHLCYTPSVLVHFGWDIRVTMAYCLHELSLILRRRCNIYQHWKAARRKVLKISSLYVCNMYGFMYIQNIKLQLIISEQKSSIVLNLLCLPENPRPSLIMV